MGDIYYIIGTAYAGKSTMVKLLAQKYDAGTKEVKGGTLFHRILTVSFWRGVHLAHL